MISFPFLFYLLFFFLFSVRNDEKIKPRRVYKAKKLLEFLPLKFPLMDLYTDRVANQRGVGVRVVIVSLDGIVLEKSMRLSFSLTNNEAKY